MLLYRHTDGVSDDFAKISDHFPKISEDFPKLFRRPDERSRTFPKISEDCRRLSRKIRRCFDHTPTNLSTLKETNLISVKSSISSHVRIWKIRHSSPGCSFVWILQVVYFPVKHSCLYNEHLYCINTSELSGELLRVNMIFSQVEKIIIANWLHNSWKGT